MASAGGRRPGFRPAPTRAAQPPMRGASSPSPSRTLPKITQTLPPPLAPGVLDNRKCISYWTIEHRGVIPREMRPPIGDWVFGCDLCQEVCPINAAGDAQTPRPSADAFGPLLDGRPALEELLSLDEEAFRARFRESALWRTRRSGLLRNACIALGNVADRSSVPALRRAIQDRDPLVRGHAAWALA